MGLPLSESKEASEGYDVCCSQQGREGRRYPEQAAVTRDFTLHRGQEDRQNRNYKARKEPNYLAVVVRNEEENVQRGEYGFGWIVGQNRVQASAQPDCPHTDQP